MSTPSSRIADRLALAQIALINVLEDASLQAAFARYGYDAGRFERGQSLCDTAMARQQAQKVAYGQLLAAREALVSSESQTQREYMHDVKVARVALANDRSALQQLDLLVRRQTSRTDWLLQAQHFYTNALANTAILDVLAGYGLTQIRLEDGKQRVAAVNRHHATQVQQVGMAQAATRARDETMQELEGWMREFRQIARLAFKGQPETLLQLGLTARKPRVTKTTDEHAKTSRADAGV
jgi:hypothetical protein